MRALMFLSASALVACASTAAPSPRSAPAPESVAEAKPKPRRAPVSVTGLEGTLTAYDVRDTMERRYEELDVCHSSTVTRIPRVAGRAAFAIHVLRDGTVGKVSYEHSDLGDRELEACILEVVRTTKFPSPHGGEADVKWAMVLESERPGPGPEHWEPERVRGIVRKRASRLRQTCEMQADGSTYRVTAYVNRSGRVVSAGVISNDYEEQDELLDCIAKRVRGWRMPRPKRLAKVSFNLQ